VTRASVQAIRLAITAIDGGVVCLEGGDYRAVLEVGGSVQSADLEQHRAAEAMLAGFAAFLNGLSYPIQIAVRAVPVDLVRYVATLEERARQILPAQLGPLAHDHAAFVQGLAHKRTLVERRFYVIVPAEMGQQVGWHWRRPASEPSTAAQAEAAARQLHHRCTEIAVQLGRCGLHTRRLDDLELAQLYLGCWSPERARAQRFRQRLDDYTTLAVRAATATGSAK
jgi:hypothetical protein